MAAEQWKHCPGEDNLANLPSRRVTSTELAGSTYSLAAWSKLAGQSGSER